MVFQVADVGISMEDASDGEDLKCPLVNKARSQTMANRLSFAFVGFAFLLEGCGTSAPSPAPTPTPISPLYYAMYIENAQNTTYSLSISEPFERLCDSCAKVPHGTWVSTAPDFAGEGWELKGLSSGLIEVHPGDIIHGVIKMTFRPDDCGGEGSFGSGARVNITLANDVQCVFGFDIYKCGTIEGFSGDWGTPDVGDWVQECDNQIFVDFTTAWNLVNFTIKPPLHAQAFEPAMV